MRQPHQPPPSPDVPAIPAPPAAIAAPRAEPSLLDDPATDPALAAVLADMYRRWPILARDADHPLTDHIAKCDGGNYRRSRLEYLAWVAGVLAVTMLTVLIRKYMFGAITVVLIGSWFILNPPLKSGIPRRLHEFHAARKRGGDCHQRLTTLRPRDIVGICSALNLLQARRLRQSLSYRVRVLGCGVAAVAGLIGHLFMHAYHISPGLVWYLAMQSTFLLICMAYILFPSENSVASVAMQSIGGHKFRFQPPLAPTVLGFVIVSLSPLCYEAAFLAGFSCIVFGFIVSMAGLPARYNRQKDSDNFNRFYAEAVIKLPNYPVCEDDHA